MLQRVILVLTLVSSQRAGTCLCPPAIFDPPPPNQLHVQLPLSHTSFNVSAGMPQLDLTPGGQRVIFGALSVVFNLMTFVLPASLQIYITATSATMLLQQLLLRIPAVGVVTGAHWA